MHDSFVGSSTEVRPPASVIVAATPYAGHTNPMLQIAAGLVQRGHTVTALVGQRFQRDAERIGALFVPLPPSADFDDRRFLEIFPEVAQMPPFPDANDWIFHHVFFDAMPAQQEALQLLLDADPEQVLVADSIFLGAWPQALGAPGRRPRRTIPVSVNPLFVSSDDTGPFGPIRAEDGMDARVLNRAANDAYHAALAPSNEHLQALLQEMGATERPPVFTDALAMVGDRVAQLTVEQFDFPRSDRPAGLAYVGLLPSPPTPDGWQQPGWWSDLDDRPVVVVTQGTLANHDLTELIEPTLLALADHDVLVVAALGRDRDAIGIDLPPNVRVEPFIPFDQLLPRADVLVTNGGFGATQQALANGVPVVVAGASEEKPAVAARVAFHGVGVDLRTARPGQRQLADAVTRVLAEAEFRQRAADLAEVYAGRDAVDLIEQLAIG